MECLKEEDTFSVLLDMEYLLDRGKLDSGTRINGE